MKKNIKKDIARTREKNRDYEIIEGYEVVHVYSQKLYNILVNARANYTFDKQDWVEIINNYTGLFIHSLQNENISTLDNQPYMKAWTTLVNTFVNMIRKQDTRSTERNLELVQNAVATIVRTSKARSYRS